MALSKKEFKKIYRCKGCHRELFLQEIAKLPNPKNCPFCGTEIKDEKKKL